MTDIKDSIKKFRKAINDASDKQLITLLGTLRKEGRVEIIPDLLKRWRETDDNDLKENLFRFFVDVKDEGALHHIIDAINQSEDDINKTALISILWQSNLDSSEYFDELVDIALDGDMLTILEVSTVIDSYESVFAEDTVMDVIYKIQEHIDEENDPDRGKMLLNLKQIVSELPVE